MDKVTIIVFGDSITYGASDKEKSGWVNILRLYLENCEDKKYKVYNMGIPGQVTDKLLERFRFECNFRFDKNDKTILIFAIGINDTQFVNGEDRIDIENFKENIIELIRQAKQYTNDIHFIGLTNVDESRVTPLPLSITKSYLNLKIERFDNELEKICRSEMTNYIKMYNFLTIDELADGLHPNSKGHQKMFENIKESFLYLTRNK